MAYIALLDVGLMGKYRGIYRRPPIFTKKKYLYSQWIDYMEITEGGFPIEYTHSNYNKMFSFYIQLLNENEVIDFVLIEKDIDLRIKTDLLGYDVTNSTMFYSILGENYVETKSFIDKNCLNDNRLFKDRYDANMLSKYMNDNIFLFESEGAYKSVSIYKMIV